MNCLSAENKYTALRLQCIAHYKYTAVQQGQTGNVTVVAERVEKIE